MNYTMILKFSSADYPISYYRGVMGLCVSLLYTIPNRVSELFQTSVHFSKFTMFILYWYMTYYDSTEPEVDLYFFLTPFSLCSWYVLHLPTFIISMTICISYCIVVYNAASMHAAVARDCQHIQAWSGVVWWGLGSSLHILEQHRVSCMALQR